MHPPLVMAFESSVHERTLVKLVLSAPPTHDNPARSAVPSRQTVRIVEFKAGLQLQWTARIGKQEVHENLSLEQSCSKLGQLFPSVYREANLLTSQAERHDRSRNGISIQVHQKGASRPAPPVTHNRKKHYLIREGEPCPFLEAIGVMAADGRVYARMQHKFHQVNRFLELVNDVLPHLRPNGQLQVVDFGSRKSYLTFALHHLLTRIHGREVRILAIDQNEDVIATCRRLSNQLHLSGIDFAAQPITTVEHAGPVDLAVSLHACDGATDQALAQAVQWQSQVILAVPCCQHEVARQIASAPLDLVLRHGILKERFAALATDALRAAALQAVGYQTQVLEFIDLDHTAKNLLIRAIRRKLGAMDDEYLASYAALKESLGLGAIQTDGLFKPCTSHTTNT